MCDDVNLDDDDDGVNDESDDCPTSYNAPVKQIWTTMTSGCTNQDDDDDDNDGVIDHRPLPVGSPNIISTPNNDVDEDGCLNDEDSTTTMMDGTTRSKRPATNPLDAGGTPVDTDGDEPCDKNNSDDDNDGVNDEQDRFRRMKMNGKTGMQTVSVTMPI